MRTWNRGKSAARLATFVAAIASMMAACASSPDSDVGAATVDGAGGGGGGGHGGDASVGSSGGPSDVLDPSVAALAAVFLGSCVPDDGINRTLERMYTRRSRLVYEAMLAHPECFVDKTTGCDAVAECVGITLQPSPTDCGAECNGDTLELCNDGFELHVDCSKMGLSCVAGMATCFEGPATPVCSSDSFTTSCDGGSPVACVDGHVMKGPECAALGLVCGTEPFEGDAACVGEGPACSAESTSSIGVELDDGIACDEAKLRTCVNGAEHLLACSDVAQGFGCQGAASPFCGLDTACTPGTKAGACEGNQVVVCNAGRVDTFDCTKLGFSGCASGFCVWPAYHQP